MKYVLQLVCVLLVIAGVYFILIAGNVVDMQVETGYFAAKKIVEAAKAVR